MDYRKKAKFLIALAVLSSAGSLSAAANADYNKLPAMSTSQLAVYRLYNPNSGEHFYTTGSNERSHLISLGWRDESIGWYAPAKGAAVYRLYNPNAGDHYYTQSPYERDSLVKAGWHAEGTGWKSAGDLPVYVVYNPNAKAGAHNYTTSMYEQKNLLSQGWKYSAEAWEAAASGTPSKGTLPAAKPEADKTIIDLDASINEMQKLVVAKGEVAVGTRVIIFHDMGMTTGDYDNGVYAPGSKLKFTPHGSYADTHGIEMQPAESIFQFYSSSFYPQAADGAGNETAVLTATGWYLLPDVETFKLDGTFMQPDLKKFIQSGNPKDLTSYTDGSALIYNDTDQFGGPVKISE